MMSPMSTSISILDTNKHKIWSQYLDRRIMRLLLQSDQQLLQNHFRIFYTESTLPKIPLFLLYDNYLKILIFRDELLDDILPRIRRQLSLQTRQLPTLEEAPTQGEIDWSSTILRTLNETPGSPPLRFDTTQQQQSTLIPENLFVVAILLNYLQAVQELLKKDLADEILNAQERQQLLAIEEHIERELAAPYTHALLPEAKGREIEQLAEEVYRRLPPGNSAYRDIYYWWEQFNTLSIGRIADRKQPALVNKHIDERTSSWLYELWIVLELLHLLDKMQSITPADIHIEADQIRFLFTWNTRKFNFTYNRQAFRGEDTVSGWNNIRATHSCYTFEREHPLEVHPQHAVIWREPPVIGDISYNDFDTMPGSASPTKLQKMLGEMRLHNTQHGVLFTPLLPEPSLGEHYLRAHRESSIYTDGMSYNLADPNIRLCKLVPGTDLEVLQERLKILLDDLTSQETLPERPQPECHGIIIDLDTINASRTRPGSYTVLCPKPHIGKGVFDLVHDKIHCLKDPLICHIYGQAKLAPFVIRVMTQEAMNEQSSEIRARAEETLSQTEQSDDEGKAEQLRSHIFLGVGRTVEQYVKLRGNTTTLETYFEEWIFGEYWKTHPRCLAAETRNMLLSGAYVWDEYQQTNLQDWAAPAVQFCRALEIEIKRRLYDYYPDPHLNGFRLSSNSSHMTLGSVKFIYLKRYTSPDARHNWGLFTQIVAHSHCKLDEFTAIMQRMVNENVADNRNQLAHSSPTPKTIALELRDAIIGRKGKPGILYWLTEHLEPKL